MNKRGICLNIGCWVDAPEEWKNIDASPYIRISKIPMVGGLVLSAIGGPKLPTSVKYGDLVKGLDITHGDCDLIFASHILEHLTLSDFHIAMNNIYSYLKPGGIFRAIVPDLEKYIAIYTSQRPNGALSLKAAHMFMQESGIGHLGSRSNLFKRLYEVFSNSRHQWMWDEPSLSDAFAQHGFKNIRRCDYGDWSDPRFASVENKNRHWNAICLEGTK